MLKREVSVHLEVLANAFDYLEIDVVDCGAAGSQTGYRDGASVTMSRDGAPSTN